MTVNNYLQGFHNFKYFFRGEGGTPWLLVFPARERFRSLAFYL